MGEGTKGGKVTHRNVETEKCMTSRDHGLSHAKSYHDWQESSSDVSSTPSQQTMGSKLLTHPRATSGIPADQGEGSGVEHPACHILTHLSDTLHMRYLQSKQ